MGISVSKNASTQDNSVRQDTISGSNKLEIGGNIGGGSNQGSDQKTDGKVDAQIPLVPAMLINLNDVMIIDARSMNLQNLMELNDDLYF